MVYICPGGNCTGIAIFFFDKVSHLKHPSAHHLSSSVFEVTATSLAEYCEKLQQRRSRVARLVSCRRMSTLKGFRHFVIYFTHLQPLWRTTKRSGLTKEWTKAT